MTKLIFDYIQVLANNRNRDRNSDWDEIKDEKLEAAG
jgi:hypothetical protein